MVVVDVFQNHLMSKTLLPFLLGDFLKYFTAAVSEPPFCSQTCVFLLYDLCSMLTFRNLCVML